MEVPTTFTKDERKGIDEVADLMEKKRQVTRDELNTILSDKDIRPKVREWIEFEIQTASDAVEHITASTVATLKGDSSASKVMRTNQALKLSGQLTTPTGLLPLFPTFGLAELSKGKQLTGARRVKFKRWIFLPDEEREVKIDLAYREYEGGVEPLERQLRSICDPLGLKVILGVLFFCHRNHRAGWFTYNPNSFCELLGYAPTSRGYYQSQDKRRIESRIQTLLKARYRCEWTGGARGRIPLEASLLLLDPNSNVELVVDDSVVSKGQIIYFCGPLYQDIVENNMYSWVDSRFLQLDSKKHGRAILLGTYYSTAWRIDWNKSRGRLHRKLRTILSDSGIPMVNEQRNLSRTVNAVKCEHDFMVNEGLIKDWSIVERARDPLDAIWEIVIPDNHGLMVAWEKPD